VFYKAGTYSVKLTVSDGADSASKTKTVTVGKQFPGDNPPVAVIEVTDNGGGSFYFDGSKSFDPDAGQSISSWNWKFGDGSSGSGATITHSFAEGSYIVVLTVTSNGLKGSATTSVSWFVVPGNHPPVASFTWFPFSVKLNETIVQFVNDSYDLDGDPLTYSWNFADPASGADNSSSAENPEHLFVDDAGRGYFDVVLSVSDGKATDTIQKRIFVGPLPNLPPVAAFVYKPPNPMALVDVVKFDDLSFDLDGGGIVGRTWLVNGIDAVPGDPNALGFEKTFFPSGVYNVSLYVEDSGGLTDCVVKQVNVLDADPALIANIPTIVSVSADDAVIGDVGSATVNVRVNCKGGLPGVPFSNPPVVKVGLVDSITQQDIGVGQVTASCADFDAGFVAQFNVSKPGTYRAVATLKSPICNVCEDGSYFSVFKGHGGWEKVPEMHPLIAFLVVLAVLLVVGKKH